MKRPSWIRNLCLFGLAAASVLALAQGTLFKDGLPKAHISIKDLPDDYQAVALRSVSDSGFGEIFNGPMGMFMMMGSMGSSSNSQQQQQVMHVLDAAAVSFTKGETTEVQGVKFLITYKVALDASHLQSIMEAKSQPDMELVLIRFDSVKGIVPKPDFTKAALLAMFVPPTEAEVRNSPAAKTVTLSNFKQVSLGMMIYMSDYDDEMPYVQDTKSALAVIVPYTKNKELFKSLNPNSSEFRLNMAVSGVNASAIPAPAETPLFYESAAWPDGTRCVSFCDSHAKFVDAEEWSRLQPALHLKLPRKGKPLPPFYWKQLHFDDAPSGGARPTTEPVPTRPPPARGSGG